MFEGIGTFTNIGTMGAYLQQQKLRHAANFKVKTGQRLSDAVKQPATSNLVESMMRAQRKTDDEAAKQRVSLIKQKLMSGRKISQSEIEYLRDRDPDLYKKAKKTEEYRQELRARLKSCKTKQEARQAVTQIMLKASAEATAELAAAKAAAGGGGAAAGFAGNGQAPAGVGGQAASGLLGAAGSNAAGNAPEAVPAEGTATAGNAKPMAGEGIPTSAPAAAAAGQAQYHAAAAPQQDSGQAPDTVQAQDAGMAGHGDTSDGKATNGAQDEPRSGKPGANVMQPAAGSGQNGLTADSILEKFIMIVRAIDDEWATFARSQDYRDLPDGPREDAEEKARGARRKRPLQAEEPSPETQAMLHAYRESKIWAEELRLRDILAAGAGS